MHRGAITHNNSQQSSTLQYEASLGNTSGQIGKDWYPLCSIFEQRGRTGAKRTVGAHNGKGDTTRLLTRVADCVTIQQPGITGANEAEQIGEALPQDEETATSVATWFLSKCLLSRGWRWGGEECNVPV